MSESLAMQWQGLVSMFLAHITTREHGGGGVPGNCSWGAKCMSRGYAITDPAPYWMLCSSELAPSLTSGITWESRSYGLPEQHSEVGPGGRGVGEPALMADGKGRSELAPLPISEVTWVWE